MFRLSLAYMGKQFARLVASPQSLYLDYFSNGSAPVPRRLRLFCSEGLHVVFFVSSEVQFKLELTWNAVAGAVRAIELPHLNLSSYFSRVTSFSKAVWNSSIDKELSKRILIVASDPADIVWVMPWVNARGGIDQLRDST